MRILIDECLNWRLGRALPLMSKVQVVLPTISRTRSLLLPRSLIKPRRTSCRRDGRSYRAGDIGTTGIFSPADDNELKNVNGH